MSKGFFSTAVLRQTDPANLRTPRCGDCGLHKICHTSKMLPVGEGREKILLIAEAPGQQEDKQGIPLAGATVQLLQSCLKSIGIDLYRDCWTTNAIICALPKHETKKQQTQKQQRRIESCRANVFKTITELSPNVVILLGAVAVRSVIGKVWKESIGKLDRWTGWQIPNQNPNVWIVPTWHPAQLTHREEPVLDVLFTRHLKRAVGLAGSPPYEVVPDYKKEIDVEVRPSVAARVIKQIRRLGKRTAFDYETNCLKPEIKGARILSCAISNGEQTIAYPWHGEAAEQTKKLLASGCPMAAHNAKFEERWSRIHAGGSVKNWFWCSMVTAHILDNRAMVSGLKFQSFVNFGVGDYDSHTDPYKQSGKNGLNKLAQLNIKDLLRYNGMDALLTWKLVERQIGEVHA